MSIVAEDQKLKIVGLLQGCHDTVVLGNIMSLLERSIVGEAKYGTTLDRDDLDEIQWMQHLLEELLDASNYLKKIMQGKQQ